MVKCRLEPKRQTTDAGAHIIEQLSPCMALQKIFLSRYQALNFVSTHFHFVSLGAEATLSEEILLHVAQFFTDETDCKKLAVFLGDPGGSDFLAQLKRKRSRITPKGIALKILQQWRKEEGEHATRDELLQVLRDDLGWSNIEAQLAAAQQRGETSRTIARQAIARRNSFTSVSACTTYAET